MGMARFEVHLEPREDRVVIYVCGVWDEGSDVHSAIVPACDLLPMHRAIFDALKSKPELLLDLLVELRDEVDARLEELATTDQG